MDDNPELHYMLPVGIFFAIMICMGVFQVLRLMSRGGTSGLGLINLVASVFILGIICWVAFTAMRVWM